jgi:hypothetical protein
MIMQHRHPGGDRSQCQLCRNNISFDLPAELYQAVLDGSLVLFAGAGVSTESNIMPVRPPFMTKCARLYASSGRARWRSQI